MSIVFTDKNLTEVSAINPEKSYFNAQAIFEKFFSLASAIAGNIVMDPRLNQSWAETDWMPIVQGTELDRDYHNSISSVIVPGQTLKVVVRGGTEAGHIRTGSLVRVLTTDELHMSPRKTVGNVRAPLSIGTSKRASYQLVTPDVVSANIAQGDEHIISSRSLAFVYNSVIADMLVCPNSTIKNIARTHLLK